MYAGIDQIVLTQSYRASAVCDVLAVSRSGFYAWRSQEASLREKDDLEMSPLVDEIFWHHRRHYGARRIQIARSGSTLRSLNERISLRGDSMSQTSFSCVATLPKSLRGRRPAVRFVV